MKLRLGLLLHIRKLLLSHLEIIETVHLFAILRKRLFGGLTLFLAFTHILLNMSKIDPKRVYGFYKSTVLRSYVFGFISFYVGMQICDIIFYDNHKHQVSVEQTEDQFWKINGEPKHLKPQLVKSAIDPTKMRKSWIQIIYGKDKYVSKEQAQ